MRLTTRIGLQAAVRGRVAGWLAWELWTEEFAAAKKFINFASLTEEIREYDGNFLDSGIPQPDLGSCRVSYQLEEDF